jgi:gamma-glutamylcyclotransferase (GGCT)/AIG2-like uncharacterized protein YtfP
MEVSDKLFVYGTLLREIDNPYTHFLRRHGQYGGKGYFFGKLYDIGHYPGAVHDPACNEKVFGDIILLKNKEEVLNRLDAYEGVGEDYLQPNEYIRKVLVVFREKQPLYCWTYLYNYPPHHLKKISSGNYLQYLKDIHHPQP